MQAKRRSSPGESPPPAQHLERRLFISESCVLAQIAFSVNMASQTIISEADTPEIPVPEALGSQKLQPNQEQKERQADHACHGSRSSSIKYLDAVPNLSKLFRLVVKRVAWQWEKLATMLELDNDGRKIDAIRRDFWGVGVEICCMQAIHHWVRGEGKEPVSWRTLLKCLVDIDCAQVAEEIAKQLEGEP